MRMPHLLKASVCALQAESLSKISQEAVELPMKEVAPALSRVERVQELLQSAMDALGTIGKD